MLVEKTLLAVFGQQCGFTNWTGERGHHHGQAFGDRENVFS